MQRKNTRVPANVTEKARATVAKKAVPVAVKKDSKHAGTREKVIAALKKLHPMD